jgi:pimeloyl-ACP methyl ester carboxylesterase
MIEIAYQGHRLALSSKLRPGPDHLLLFLHGLGCTKQSFDGAFAAAGLNNYSICTLDLLGFGDSDKPDYLSYTMEEHAETVRLVLEQLAFAKVSIVAHSMGGAVGLLLAQNLPNLERFISVEGKLITSGEGIATSVLASLLYDEFLGGGSDRFLAQLQSSPRPAFKAWAGWYRQASPRAIHAGARSLVHWADSGRLLEMFNHLPDATYIYGGDSTKSLLLPQLIGAKVVKIPNAGHFPMLDNPDKFYAAIEL